MRQWPNYLLAMKTLTTRNILIFKIIIFAFASGTTAQTANVDYGTIAGQWTIEFGTADKELTDIQVGTKSTVNIPLRISNVETESDKLYFEIHIEDEKYAHGQKRIYITEFSGPAVTWQGELAIEGKYFGYTNLYVSLSDPEANRIERNPKELNLIVVRDKRVDDLAFTYTAGAIMLLMFINLGTVLDLKRVGSMLLRPLGPLIGFSARFIVMPALALGLGMLLFKHNKNLQLALFFSALAPSGGIANICNIFLKGNIHLSLATTSLNSLFGLGMLPLWILIIKPVLFNDSSLTLPWIDLVVGCVGLLLAIFVGVFLRLCIPKTTKFIFRFLKPLSVFLSLCLVAVTVGINAFVFKEVTGWVS